MTLFSIRPASSADDAAITDLESLADRLFIDRFEATNWPPPSTAEERASWPGFVLVATSAKDQGTTPTEVLVGFVHVIEAAAHAHLEQLSVSPDYGRRGIGRALVNAAMAEARRRGHSRMTLRTYREVPWNAPFYASCGFAESEPDSPFLRSLIRAEQDLGISDYGPRVQMTAAL